jgi:hypothetical protein
MSAPHPAGSARHAMPAIPNDDVIGSSDIIVHTNVREKLADNTMEITSHALLFLDVD